MVTKKATCTEQNHRLPVQDCYLCGKILCPACGTVLRFGSITNDYICPEHLDWLGKDWIADERES
jgi:hypothetical protein